MSYVIHNHTLLVQEFEVRIGASDTFMYSGQRLVQPDTRMVGINIGWPHSSCPPPLPHTHTQCRFRVLPTSSHTLTYNLYPVATGLLPLPHLDLSYQRDPKFNEYLTHSTLPTTIFIKVRGADRHHVGYLVYTLPPLPPSHTHTHTSHTYSTHSHHLLTEMWTQELSHQYQHKQI